MTVASGHVTVSSHLIGRDGAMVIAVFKFQISGKSYDREFATEKITQNKLTVLGLFLLRKSGAVTYSWAYKYLSSGPQATVACQSNPEYLAEGNCKHGI